MDYALENNYPVKMPQTKARKKDTMKHIKDKLENAKLNLIYTELEEAGIGFVRGYESVDRLLEDFKKRNELDYNKVKSICDNVSNQLESMVRELEKGSTKAFTNTMTGSLAKSIGKTLGITLAGRTAMILAPTLASKALIGAGLAGYGLYRAVKSRKEIVKANEATELNNILMDLESTKDGDKYLDTRFSEEVQEDIRKFLKDNNVYYTDTGYRSLRAVIYNLDNDKKRLLCETLNNKLAKVSNIEERVKKAKKKLNVAASTSAGVSAGAALGIQVATTINSIDPALLAGAINSTVLAAWIQSIAGKDWLTGLTAGVGMIGTEVLSHLPIIGTVISKGLAAENLAVLAGVGAIGGAVVSAGLGIASVVKRIHDNSKTKKETQNFLALDASKYEEQDKIEFEKIKNNPHEEVNMLEACVVDLVVGSLKEDGVELHTNPTSVAELNEVIKTLDKDERKKAVDLLKTINDNLDNNPAFVRDLKKAGKISIGIFTAGLAALSVYDIIKGGAFLPELSQKIFPTNNMNAPVAIPESLDSDLDTDLPKDAVIAKNGEKIFGEFSDPKYMTERNGNYETSVGSTLIKYDGTLDGQYTGAALVDAGITENAVNNSFFTKLLEDIGIIPKAVPTPVKVPDIALMADRINELSPKELYDFYRYFNTLENDGSAMYEALKGILGFKTFTDRATSVITDAKNLQAFNDMVNNITRSVGTIAVPVATAAGTLGTLEKTDTNSEFDEEHSKKM